MMPCYSSLVRQRPPEDIFKIWEVCNVNKTVAMKDRDNCLKVLLQFLKTEVEAEKKIWLHENCFA